MFSLLKDKKIRKVFVIYLCIIVVFLLLAYSGNITNFYDKTLQIISRIVYG